MNVQDLQKLKEKPERLIIGLMSGTSADGVDACLCRIKGFGPNTSVSLCHMSSRSYPPSVRRLLLEKIAFLNVEEVARLNFIIGEIFAQAAMDCVRESGLKPEDIDAISSHGQTLIHLPNRDNPDLPEPATLQVGDISVIAQKTGILTIGDFRPADMAQGGQGAPLVPYADFVLFRSDSLGRVVQNIGGIANLTYLPPSPDIQDIVAFDTGPGNMVVDALVSLITDGRETMDKDGNMALKGKVVEPLLNRLLENPYFRQNPPKSTGRELFGVPYARDLLSEYRSYGYNSYEDLIATASELTVRTIVDSYKKWLLPRGPLHQVIVGGGGSRNKYFMKRLKEELSLFHPQPELLTHDDLGIPDKAKECVAFAILGNEVIGGNPNNVPSSTGAAKRVILGKVAFPGL